ncbi:MAG: hypothetical protein WDN49_10585 [Acetobacteraceae bacterium]
MAGHGWRVRRGSPGGRRDGSPLAAGRAGGGGTGRVSGMLAIIEGAAGGGAVSETGCATGGSGWAASISARRACGCGTSGGGAIASVAEAPAPPMICSSPPATCMPPGLSGRTRTGPLAASTTGIVCGRWPISA